MQLRLRLVLVLLLVFVAGLLAGGCGHVPVATMYKLWSFDVATADPAAIRAAVRGPAVLAPRPGGAKLTVTVKRPDRAAPEVHEFGLAEAQDAQEMRQLTRFQRAGYPLAAYRLSSPDIARMKSLQSDLRAAKARGDKWQGSLGVAMQACTRGPLPEGALLSSTYLKLDEEAGYLPVLEDIDLRKEIGPEKLEKEIPPCAAPVKAMRSS